MLLELLRDELELDVVGRVRVFIEDERLTLVRERDELELELERLTFVRERDELELELERFTLDLSRDELVVERLKLDRERDELEFEVVVLYCGREVLLVLDENDRFEVVVGRL